MHVHLSLPAGVEGPAFLGHEDQHDLLEIKPRFAGVLRVLWEARLADEKRGSTFVGWRRRAIVGAKYGSLQNGTTVPVLGSTISHYVTELLKAVESEPRLRLSSPKGPQLIERSGLGMRIGDGIELEVEICDAAAD